MASTFDLKRLILKRAFGDTLPDRTLVVSSDYGLNNRIRVLTSGLAVAEATGRTFAMLWPNTPMCGAAFDMLFQNPWPVVDPATLPASLQPFKVSRWSDKRLRSLLKDPRQHIILDHHTWLVSPDAGSAFVSLQQRCVQLVDALQPVATIATRVEAFRARHFSPTMIGVHLRRGDFNRCLPYYTQNTRAAYRAVDRLLEQDPQAGILLHG